MTFSEAVKACLNKYACFDGRARRSEYWFFYLFNLIVSLAAAALSSVLGGDDSSSALTVLASLALFLPNLSVSVRRLHDVGKSGWYLFISLIPLAGVILLLVKLLTAGDEGQNAYGQDPKALFADAAYTRSDNPTGAYEAYNRPAGQYAGTEYTDEIMKAASGKYCAYCGSKLSSSQKYCDSCGAKAE